jgi:3-dehydroquinate dehydratase II
MDTSPSVTTDALLQPLNTPRKIVVLHGPNINLLGEREPEVYGERTLEDLDQMLINEAKLLGGLVVHTFQSNHEGALIDTIHAARSQSDGMIINPGAYTHTSIAIRDALSAYPNPVIEVHLSNIHRRESFRQQSFISPVVSGVICGLSFEGYRLALHCLHTYLMVESREDAPQEESLEPIFEDTINPS